MLHSIQGGRDDRPQETESAEELARVLVSTEAGLLTVAEALGRLLANRPIEEGIV